MQRQLKCPVEGLTISECVGRGQESKTTQKMIPTLAACTWNIGTFETNLGMVVCLCEGGGIPERPPRSMTAGTNLRR